MQRIKNGDINHKVYWLTPPANTCDQLYANQDLKNKSIKGIGFHNETSMNIYHLTPKTKGLLYKVRKKCKTLGYKKIITDNGIIKVKVDNDIMKWKNIGN